MILFWYHILLVLWKCLILCRIIVICGKCWFSSFIRKKTAAEAHRELQKVYGDAALSETTCRDWFRRFKDGDFNVDDRPREGRPKTFEDAELEALLNEDPCQTQEELASVLGVTRQSISKRLHALGMIQKQGTWVPYELKPRDVERRFFACEQLLQRQKRKGFLHRIVTGDEKWIHYSNPKKRKSWGLPGHASTSSPRPNIHAAKVMLCIWWDQVGVIYYELLKPSETITGDRYRLQLMRLSRALREKRPQYAERHEKVILQHDNARPHVAKPVKTYLETLKWEILPQRYIFQILRRRIITWADRRPLSSSSIHMKTSKNGLIRG